VGSNPAGRATFHLCLGPVKRASEIAGPFFTSATRFCSLVFELLASNAMVRIYLDRVLSGLKKATRCTECTKSYRQLEPGRLRDPAIEDALE
jgi:hypothetical protein